MVDQRRLGWVSLPLSGLLSVVVGRALANEGVGLRVLLPSLFPTSGGRWSGVVVAGTFTLCFALAAGANVVLRTIGEDRQRRRFAMLWICAGASALLVVATGTVGMALAADTAAGPSWPRLLTGIVVTAAHWTLTWGFAAAVVTTRIAPPRPASGLGTLLVMRVAVSSALVLGTLASGGAMLWAAGSADRADAAPPQSAVETTGHPSAAPGPSSDPSDPPLPANPVADDAYAHRCAASAVRVTFQGLDAGLGGRYAVVAAVNTGQVRCVLKGFPDVAFADLLGNNVRVKIRHGGDGGGQNATPRAITLAPGEVAHAELTWRADAGAYDREVDTILLAGWAGARRESFGGYFQVKNGTVVRVSPWLRGS